MSKIKKCKHKRHINKNEIYDEHGMIECDIVCEDCEEKIGHWAYGVYNVDYAVKYKLNCLQKLVAKIKILIFNIKWKIKYGDNSDLPF